MPINDTSINFFIESELIRLNKEREESHKASGKLSASMLYQPLRFQVLKTIGVPRREIEPYVLGKFKRGNDVEDWYVSMLNKMGVLIEAQKEVEYRGVVGLVDAVVNSDKMYFKQGTMPHEVKSVTNAKLKRIAKTEVDYHYKLQACLYALALETDYYSVDIVSAEDLRPNVYVFDTKELKDDVDDIIDNYEKAMKEFEASGKIPAFEANPQVKWTANPNYSMFNEFWMTASDKEIGKMLEKMNLI